MKKLLFGKTRKETVQQLMNTCLEESIKRYDNTSPKTWAEGYYDGMWNVLHSMKYNQPLTSILD